MGFRDKTKRELFEVLGFRFIASRWLPNKEGSDAPTRWVHFKTVGIRGGKILERPLIFYPIPVARTSAVSICSLLLPKPRSQMASDTLEVSFRSEKKKSITGTPAEV